MPHQPPDPPRDAARRREWAAAVRWFATRTFTAANARNWHRIADMIEAGQLTPWADQPQPAIPAAAPSPGDEGGTQPELGEPERCVELTRYPDGPHPDELVMCDRPRPCPVHDQPEPPGLCEATVHDRAGEPEPCGRQRPCCVAHEAEQTATPAQPDSWQSRIRAQHPEMSTDAVGRAAHAASRLFGAAGPAQPAGDAPAAAGPHPDRQRAYDAVYGVIHQYPPAATGPDGAAVENARVWRAVEAALDAAVPAGPTPGTPDRAVGVELDLDAIQARADAATPGPWHAGTTGLRDGNHWYAADQDGQAVAHVHSDDGRNEEARRPDAEFIAHARTDVPALVAEVRRLRTLADYQERHLGASHGNPPEVECCTRRDGYDCEVHPPDPQADLAPEAVTPTEPAGSLGSGILGRALLDRRGELWWQLPGCPKCPPGSVQWWHGEDHAQREEIARDDGPVREVLLVPAEPAPDAAASLGASGSTPAAEPAPEPDSGPGWNDGRIQEIIDFHASEDPQAFLVSDPGEVADQLRALLHTGRTVRTALAWMRDELGSWQARAELAESRLDGQAWEDLEAERDRLRTELATARREAAAPPAAEAVRDAAAAGVLLARQEAIPEGTAAWDDLERVADQVADGTRPVPGSPQPAGEGGGGGG